MKKSISYLLFFIATLIWGFAFVAQKAASIIPPFVVGALRSLLATLFLIGLIPITDRLTKNGRRLLNSKKFPDINRSELVGGVILGILLTVATSFQQYGIGNGTDAGKAAFITALYVIMVPILSAFFGKKPGINALVSIPIAVVGFYVLCIRPGQSFVISDLLILICALLFACQIIAVDLVSPGCDGVRLSLIQFATSLVLNGLLSLIFYEPISAEKLVEAIPSLLFLGILSSGLAYTFQILGQKEIDPTVSAVILSLESVFGVIGSALILGETMSPREYIGCGVVFLAVLLAQFNPIALIKKKPKGDKK